MYWIIFAFLIDFATIGLFLSFLEEKEKKTRLFGSFEQSNWIYIKLHVFRFLTIESHY